MTDPTTADGRAADTLMQRRAAELARPLEDAAAVSRHDLLLVSVAGGTRYALESRHVRQVVRNRGICRLPASDGELLGLVMVKGEAVPVADLGSVLGLTGANPSRPMLVVLESELPPLGLLVDEVIAVRPVPQSELRLADVAAGEGEPMERGITADGTVLLDGDVLLADHRLEHTSAATTRAHTPTTVT